VQVERIRLGRLESLSEVHAVRGWLDRHPVIHRLLVLSGRAGPLRVELYCGELLPSRVHGIFMPSSPERSRSTEYPVG
jgi:hypothetical protein